MDRPAPGVLQIETPAALVPEAPYDLVERIRPVPFDLRMLILVIAPILLPMVPLIAVEMRLLGGR